MVYTSIYIRFLFLKQLCIVWVGKEMAPLGPWTNCPKPINYLCNSIFFVLILFECCLKKKILKAETEFMQHYRVVWILLVVIEKSKVSDKKRNYKFFPLLTICCGFALVFQSSSSFAITLWIFFSFKKNFEQDVETYWVKLLVTYQPVQVLLNKKNNFE